MQFFGCCTWFPANTFQASLRCVHARVLHTSERPREIEKAREREIATIYPCIQTGAQEDIHVRIGLLC